MVPCAYVTPAELVAIDVFNAAQMAGRAGHDGACRMLSRPCSNSQLASQGLWLMSQSMEKNTVAWAADNTPRDKVPDRLEEDVRLQDGRYVRLVEWSPEARAQQSPNMIVYNVTYETDEESRVGWSSERM
jgi:hypothetical protein